MTKKKNILLFGGSFNPIHNGHLIISRFVAEKLGINRVVLIPSANHPFNKNNMSEFNHRYNMTVGAIMGEQELFDVSSCEQDSPAPSYSIDTVRRFRRCLRDSVDKIYWLIGQDNLPQLENWHCIKELSEESVIVTANRPGYPLEDIKQRLLTNVVDFNMQSIIDNIIDTPQIEISSTEIRERIKNGLSIKYLVPNSVDIYIKHNNLYEGQIIK